MALTLAEIEEAIRRALVNGESWKMGDIESRISLERLIELKEQASANTNAVSFSVASFQTPTSETD